MSEELNVEVAEDVVVEEVVAEVTEQFSLAS